MTGINNLRNESLFTKNTEAIIDKTKAGFALEKTDGKSAPVVQNDFVNIDKNITKTEKGTISNISFTNDVDITKFFNGFKKGDEITIDGPLWYDGKAKINDLSQKFISISMNMKCPDIKALAKIFGSDNIYMPYKLIDGKLNLDVSAEKMKDGSYKMIIKDKNENNKIYTMPNMKAEILKDGSLKIEDKYNTAEFKTKGLNRSEINLNGISVTLKK